MKSEKRSDNKRLIWQSAWFWIFITLLLVGGAAGWYFLLGPGSTSAQSAATTGPQYHTATVQRGDISISATGSGTLVTNNTVDLNFTGSGQVTELDVKVGDHVKKDQVLAKQAGTETLQANIASFNLQYLQALQSLETMQKNKDVALATAYQTWTTSKETYYNDVLAQQRTAYARCGEAVNTQNALALQLAKDQMDAIGMRYYGSPAWIVASQKYDTALANYNYCIAYTSDEKANAVATVGIDKVAMDAAETNYNTLKAGSGLDPRALSVAEAQVTQAMTQLQKARMDLVGATIVSPIDGTVISIAAGQGAIVDTSTYIIVADLSHPYVQISLNEPDLDKMVVGNAVSVVFQAIPENTFAGKVVQVLPSLASAGQFSVVQGLVDLSPEALKNIQTLPVGLSASINVTSKESKNTLLAPIEAVRDIGNKEYAVFVVGRDGRLRLVPVKVGLMTSSQAEILSGLNEGDTVTTGTVPTSRQG